ncbi:Peptidase S8/S53, subtilisin/kexin/sedolisin [Metarhizium album ARSEF 1941]|uniref:Peptidase S8/S53, subtilisin/kexin/sedolisin n=1 Tax=Metarhizium album (strain ARSEF 1941) TaxID=1081103 RepID=A0A0B2WNU9_METAS|nr:Peptidase S8/S53, subtilisin/kexin/sedolisin [Metarhizium album ARSEF 1941]KHN95673.1 Peptidase S8/S53, subtilisin/kexin/sedolisin [Metarhizium album ARSEF 1941]
MDSNRRRRPGDLDPNGPQSQLLKNLCETLAVPRHKQLHINCSPSTASYTHTDGTTIPSKPTITLGDLLERRPSLIQEHKSPTLSKTILHGLSFILSKSLLALVGSGWPPYPWSIDSIFFMHDREKKKADIYNPYIEAFLDLPSSGNATDNEDYYTDALSFGSILAQIELGHNITMTAEDKQDVYPPIYTALTRVFNAYMADLVDPQVREVIAACLDFKNKVLAMKRRPSVDNSRPRAALIRYIVQPLERRLCKTDPKLYDSIINGRIESIHVEFPHPGNGNRTPSGPSAQRRASTSRQFGAIDLCDVSIDCKSETRWRAEKFFDLYEKFRKLRFPEEVKLKLAESRIKIAILDTGINLDGSGLQLRRDDIIEDRKRANTGADGDPIKATRSFVGPQDDVNDCCGHGTHIADILLRLAPEVDLYIAKICNGMAVHAVDHIAEAIDWAVTEGCDIINMSFSIDPELVPKASHNKVEEAIDRADGKGKILFAAASNCGGNGKRPYPASNQKVICVHATDGLGNDAGINPPKEGVPDYFSTLGVGIKFLWDEQYVFKSGTSFATAVAAAIAANTLEFAKYWRKAADKPRPALDRLRDGRAMRKVFFELLSRNVQHHQYIAPWIFWELHKPSNPGFADDLADKLGREHQI